MIVTSRVSAQDELAISQAISASAVLGMMRPPGSKKRAAGTPGIRLSRGIEGVIPIRVAPTIPGIKKIANGFTRIPTILMIGPGGDEKCFAQCEDTFEPLAEAADGSGVGPLGPQAKAENSFTVSGLKTPVVNGAQGGAAQERMHCLRISGSQNQIQMYCLGVLGILNQLLHQAAPGAVALQEVADILNIRFRWMLDSAKPNAPW